MDPTIPISECSEILPRSKRQLSEVHYSGIIDDKMRSNVSHVFKYLNIRTKALQQAEETSKYSLVESLNCVFFP